MALKVTVTLILVATVGVGMVVLVALGTFTVLEGLALFAMVSVFIGLCAMTDADDWFSGPGGEDGDGGGDAG